MSLNPSFLYFPQNRYSFESIFWTENNVEFETSK